MNLIEIIREYQKSAKKAVDIFKQVYDVDDILERWHRNLYKQVGTLERFGIVHYAFHGIGLEVHFHDSVVDFDFAYFPQPRHDGFDLWRLKQFVEDQPKRFGDFIKKGKLEEEFNDLIKHQIIARPNLSNSTSLYFFSETI